MMSTSPAWMASVRLPQRAYVALVADLVVIAKNSYPCGFVAICESAYYNSPPWSALSHSEVILLLDCARRSSIGAKHFGDLDRSLNAAKAHISPTEFVRLRVLVARARRLLLRGLVPGSGLRPASFRRVNRELQQLVERLFDDRDALGDGPYLQCMDACQLAHAAVATPLFHPRRASFMRTAVELGNEEMKGSMLAAQAAVSKAAASAAAALRPTLAGIEFVRGADVDGGGGSSTPGERDGEEECAVPEDISFELRAAEGSVAIPLQKPFLCTKSVLTVDHLRKCVLRKMSLSPFTLIDFFDSDRYMPLEPDLTLAQIATRVGAGTHGLVLQYRIW